MSQSMTEVKKEGFGCLPYVSGHSAGSPLWCSIDIREHLALSNKPKVGTVCV